KDIHMYINSPGGSVTATLAIYDTMQMLSCPVATYCVGEACSGAAVLLIGGAKGKRFCLPNSRVMMHQPLGGVSGQVSDIEIQAAEMFRYRDKLNQIISSHCGKSVEQIAKDTDRDFFLDAQQAKEYGLVDDLLMGTPASEDDED
ncbi:ClpP family protease, partial [Rhodopirellula bahusiensis]|uniref:ClpP family protease n=1 Tax=Rhodopirellula bahusiensis TaxID=2014065 RepID=UPI00329A6276